MNLDQKIAKIIFLFGFIVSVLSFIIGILSLGNLIFDYFSLIPISYRGIFLYWFIVYILPLSAVILGIFTLFLFFLIRKYKTRGRLLAIILAIIGTVSGTLIFLFYLILFSVFSGAQFF